MNNLIKKMEEYGEQGRIKDVQDINTQFEMLKAENGQLKLAPLLK